MERFGGVTAVAPRSEIALMHIIVAMAVEAESGDFQAFPVAARALDPGVATREWKFGLCVVIESDTLPARSAVAVLTFRSKRSLVPVVFPVTGDAFSLRILEARGFMALLAFES